MNDQRQHCADKLAYEIDAWDLKVALDTGDEVVVVDARSADAYLFEHIPGAINIPHRSMSAETTNQLNKSALVVTYCDGIGCNASTKGALKMLELGFRVKELLGGLDWWKRDGYATHRAANAMTSSSCGCH